MRIAAALASLLLAGSAYAQGYIPPPGGSSSIIGGTTDVRTLPGYSCANMATAINNGITSGIKKFFLPAGCTYTPTSNLIPAGIEIWGEDWNTTVVSVANEATDHLSLGGKSVLHTVAIKSLFCKTTAIPTNTSKLCPVNTVINQSSSVVTVSNWVNQSVLLISGTTTDPSGITSVDSPTIGVLQAGSGADGIYAQSTGIASGGNSTSAIRAVTEGSNDRGLWTISGQNSPTSQHIANYISEFSDNSHSSYSFYINRSPASGQDVAPSIHIDDAGSLNSANTSSMIELSAAHQSSGNLFSIFQQTTPFSGNAINLNFGSSSGTFTGKFLSFANSGVSSAYIDANTNINIQGADSNRIIIGGTTYGMRLGVNAVESFIEGTDKTGTGSFQPLRLGGSKVTVSVPFSIGSASLTLATGEVGLSKISASGSAAGAAGGKFALVCGTSAGTAKLIIYAGTSTTPGTVLDNIGSGVTGC